MPPYCRVTTRVFFLLILIPFSVFAHEGGFSIRQEVGDYSLSLDTLSNEVVARKAEHFNLGIEQKAGTSTVPFSDVWVRITGGKGEFLF